MYVTSNNACIYKIPRKEELERKVWADERVILGMGFQISVAFIINTTILS
jgi:hypothetical protein